MLVHENKLIIIILQYVLGFIDYCESNFFYGCMLFLGGWQPRNHNFLADMSCQGNILPWLLRAAKECVLLGG